MPTPIDKFNRPDLGPLRAASEFVASSLCINDFVIYESTVYPGATEEVCIPILEEKSGLQLNEDFYCGYSPERINPGDKERPLASIVKVTSGSNCYAAGVVDSLYRSIIKAGTHRAPSIKVAEAAKVIENTQRDLNIAFVNELSLMFDGLGIDTQAVLKAASTKWNFLQFQPGLVGGHCIGVDPYYLVHKSEESGFHPNVIMSGRRVNQQMGVHVAHRLIRQMIKSSIGIKNAKVLVLGLTFKENCRDVRNTKVIDVIKTLQDFDVAVDVHDEQASYAEVVEQFGVELIKEPQTRTYDAIILAVPHTSYVALGADGLRRFGRTRHVLFDIKAALPEGVADMTL